VVALDALEHTVPGVGRSEAGLAAWHDALGHVARRLEVAWERLSAAAGDEEAAWDAEIERVRQWRRPRWPLWAITAMVFGVALYLGLVLGGFVPAPGVLRPFAEYWWSR
jgi:ABC-type Fe3+ transport system permease subunit